MSLPAQRIWRHKDIFLLDIKRTSYKTEPQGRAREKTGFYGWIMKAQFERGTSWLHLLAGGILLAFAVSHFAFLGISDPSHDLTNTVFPFLKNRTMYLLAGVLEISVALVCLLFRGHSWTNIVILAFVGVIAWYRWAFYFTGGAHCGCLGLLGKLLHISKLEETVLPIVMLCLLTLTTLPWLCGGFLKLARGRVRSVPLLAALLLACRSAHGQLAVQVSGEIDSAHYNPYSHKIFTNTDIQAEFTADLSGENWDIAITNKNDNRWWARMFFDGTNIYTFEPRNGNLYRGQLPNSNEVFATITPSPVYSSVDEDDLGISLAWAAYGFSPIAAVTNKHGVVELPLNWLYSRVSPYAHGYKWQLGDWVSGRFIDSFEVVYDHTLDLDQKSELLRWNMDYPGTLPEYNDRVKNLSARMREVPNGFVEARYRCTEWLHTNSITIPAAAELEWYWYYPPSIAEKFEYRATLKVTGIGFAGMPELLAPPNEVTYVHDYRFKRANEHRIFKYGDYQLQAGDAWKAGDDPALLAKADDWLKHGRKYDDFGFAFGVPARTVVTWLFLVITLIPVVAVLWYRTKTNK